MGRQRWTCQDAKIDSRAACRPRGGATAAHSRKEGRDAFLRGGGATRARYLGKRTIFSLILVAIGQYLRSTPSPTRVLGCSRARLSLCCRSSRNPQWTHSSTSQTRSRAGCGCVRRGATPSNISSCIGLCLKNCVPCVVLSALLGA